VEFCRLDLINLCSNDWRSVELPSEFDRFHEVLVISETVALCGLAHLWNGCLVIMQSEF